MDARADIQAYTDREAESVINCLLVLGPYKTLVAYIELCLLMYSSYNISIN